MNIPKHLQEYLPDFDPDKYEYKHGSEPSYWERGEYWSLAYSEWRNAPHCCGYSIYRRPIAQYQYIPASKAKPGDEVLDDAGLWLNNDQQWLTIEDGVALRDCAVVRRRVQP